MTASLSENRAGFGLALKRVKSKLSSRNERLQITAVHPDATGEDRWIDPVEYSIAADRTRPKKVINRTYFD